MSDLPEEAIEATMRVMYPSPIDRTFQRRQVRSNVIALLTAAAPSIRAQAFGDGHREGYQTALADFQSSTFIGGPVFDATEAIRADERRRIAEQIRASDVPLTWTKRMSDGYISSGFRDKEEVCEDYAKIVERGGQ